MRNGVRADQVMSYKKIGGNKTSRSTYFQVIIKVITVILIIIKTTIIITCRGRCSSPTTTNTALLVTLYNIQKPL